MNAIKLGTIGFVAATGLFAVMLIPSPSRAEEKALPSIEELAVRSANTPAEHEALAAFYRAKAADARAVVKTHREMAAGFVTKSDSGKAGMQAHCDRLAAAAEQEATEYDALAALHDAEAKKAAK